MGFNKKIVYITVIFLAAFIFSNIVYGQKIKVNSSAIYNSPASQTSVKLNQKAINDNNLVVIPRGRRINSRLNDNLDYGAFTLDSVRTGDIITTQLMRDWLYNNVTIAPEGSLVKGVLTVEPGISIVISFNTIIRPDNVDVKIISKPIQILTQNTSQIGSLIPFGTEFTIQIINDVITKPYEN